MERGQIVALATQVIPPENTPEKRASESLVAYPRWRYKGPACTINLEWQIGRWRQIVGIWYFDGISTRVYATRSQSASMELAEFTTNLPAIALSPLSPGYYDCEIWFKSPAFSDLRIIVQNCVRVVEVAPPPLEAPKVESLAATDITHDSATLKGRLIDTGFWSNVDCYFQWGKTTAYGNVTPKMRMYEGQEGSTFHTELLHYLEPGTTYHFRAVVVAVGYRSEEVGPGYGSDMSFTTEKEVVIGFTMRSINARPGSVYWRAASTSTMYPYMQFAQPLNYVWNWTPSAWEGRNLPDTEVSFYVWSGDADKKTTQYDGFPFRLRAGKNYVWDFAARQMFADGVKVWPPY